MALWKRALLSLVLVLAAAVAIAPSAGSPRTIPTGVRISGINVSGLDAGQARQQLSARFGSPLRFRHGDKRWSVSTERLGLVVAVEDAVSRALRAENGEDVEVRVGVDREQVRSYVDALQERFGFPAQDARIVELVKGRPQIADSSWGLAVRRRTMVVGITRMLKTRIRPTLPLVMKTLKPTITRANFGPVIVIHRGSNRLVLFKGEKLLRSFRVATGQAQYPTPTGSFRIVVMQKNPWWRPRLRLGARAGADPARARQSTRHALDGALRAARRHSRHAGRGIDRLLGFARLHPDAHSGRDLALRPRPNRDPGPDRSRLDPDPGAHPRHLPGGLRPADGLGRRGDHRRDDDRAR
jgi:L,D-transpeptidase catalytic domain/Putative peptidoglycan binding domain